MGQFCWQLLTESAKLENRLSTHYQEIMDPLIEPNIHARLGIAGLPERIQSLSRGMIYAVVADQQSIRIPLLARSAVKTIEAGLTVVLLAQAEPSAWVKKARLAGIELGQHLRSGALKIFRHQPDAVKQVFKAGAKKVIGELDQQMLEPGSLVIFDQADPFFLLATRGLPSRLVKTIRLGQRKTT